MSMDYGEAYARNTDPQTSHDAAHWMEGDEASKREREVAQAVWQCREHGAISDDIVRLTGVEWNTVTPRLCRLVEKGIIMRRIVPETGKYVTRRSLRTGKSQIVHWWRPK